MKVSLYLNWLICTCWKGTIKNWQQLSRYLFSKCLTKTSRSILWIRLQLKTILLRLNEAPRFMLQNWGKWKLIKIVFWHCQICNLIAQNPSSSSNNAKLSGILNSSKKIWAPFEPLKYFWSSECVSFLQQLLWGIKSLSVSHSCIQLMFRELKIWGKFQVERSKID